jgi:hypothetical protein
MLFGRWFSLSLLLMANCQYKTFTERHVDRTKKDLNYIGERLLVFKRHHGDYPDVSTPDDLQRVLSLTIRPTDAWGTPYRYQRSRDGQHCRLISAGRDRQFSSAGPNGELSDDIVWSDNAVKSAPR